MKFPSELEFGSNARKQLLQGVNLVADAVSSTLGPKSWNVAINQSDRAPRIIHDGVSVAKSIDLFDHFPDMGAQLLKEAAIKTNIVAGDGTTTATIIAQALINKAFEDIEAGKNPMTLKKEIEEATKLLLEKLKELSKPIEKDEDIERVATISCADPTVGKLVAEAVQKVGKEGVITTEIGKGMETIVEYKQGLEFDRGYYSPYFVTDQEKVEAVVNDAYILLTDIKINHAYQIVDFLNNFIKWCEENKKPRNLVIVGETLEDALATLVVNKIKGVVNVMSVQAPAYGGRRVDELEDLAILTGGSVIMADSGRELKSVQMEELGRAGKVVADRDKTTILDGLGESGKVKQRIEDLRKQVEVSNTEYDGAIKKQRIAKLSGGVAIISVGGQTEVELSDKKERVIDAVNAAKASMEEGIIAGGQIALMTLAQGDFWPDTLGAGILRHAIKQPFKVLMENTGYDYAESLSKITPIQYPRAVNVETGEVENLIETGVIDPVKVTRSAIENAVSVAGMTMTTKVLISQPYQDHATK